MNNKQSNTNTKTRKKPVISEKEVDKLLLQLEKF